MPLADLARNTELRKHDFDMSEAAKRTTFPIRALRYWWVFHCLRNLAQYGKLTIVDMGAGNGQMRRYWSGAAELYGLPDQPLQRWIALDRLKHPRLLEAGYETIIQCDFDQVLPLEDGFADVVICLHVVEHLPRPEFTLREINRTLRKDGVLLAGSPTAPGVIAFLIERWLKKRAKERKIAPGGHINSLSPRRWKRLIVDSGMCVDCMVGTHFLRSSGFFLENYAAWIRLNLLWGATFPSLGSEVYLRARKK